MRVRTSIDLHNAFYVSNTSRSGSFSWVGRGVGRGEGVGLGGGGESPISRRKSFGRAKRTSSIVYGPF